MTVKCVFDVIKHYLSIIYFRSKSHCTKTGHSYLPTLKYNEINTKNEIRMKRRRKNKHEYSENLKPRVGNEAIRSKHQDACNKALKATDAASEGLQRNAIPERTFL